LVRATKLVKGLSIEGKRWEEKEAFYTFKLTNIIGNVFLVAACFAYLGPFNLEYRSKLMKLWFTNVTGQKVDIDRSWSLDGVMSTEGETKDWKN
jgi:dynein heavy chain, axonemal